MNDFKRLNELVNNKKAELNALYDDLDNELITKALKICALIRSVDDSKSLKLALAHRIIALKPDPLENELKKLKFSKDERLKVQEKIYEYVKNFYEIFHANLIKTARDEKILDEFYLVLLDGMHEVGLAMNALQIAWQAHIINNINENFRAKFKNLSEANEFIDKNALFQTDINGAKADRSYGAVLKDNKNFSFAPYAVVFKDEVKKISSALKKLSLNLKRASDEILAIKNESNLAIKNSHKSYIEYFNALNLAFCERDNSHVIAAWQKAEIAWMSVKGKLQPAHPLEYYEDAYTHAVAPEWDLRLADDININEQNLKSMMINTYNKICENIGAKGIKAVFKNIERTQLYISVPMLYYGAELNGLFSAQVVPNDEFVSAKCGKKIFAFASYVYQSSKAKPFLRLSSEIFAPEFLDSYREVLFLRPEIWYKIYEISTIGHEFGHILFIDYDTESAMNRGGVFKFIEEFKATSGGLINFFMHEDERLKMHVLTDLIMRAVGLISWRKVDEVRAYYCEGLIHLSLLFSAGVIKFNGERLNINLNEKSYARFKDICLKNYNLLAKHYTDKRDASEFLAKFCISDKDSFLPKDEAVREFVEYYYAKFEKIGNELDSSNERQKWLNLAKLKDKKA